MERFVRVRGLRTRCIEAGSGTPVILLHGASLGSSSDVYVPSVPKLAASGFHAIAYDQPGYGETDAPPDFSEDYRCGFLLDLLDACGVARAHLLAHSRTGEWAARVALDHPGMVGKVVMAATLTMLPPRTAGSPPRRSAASAQVMAPGTAVDTREALAPDVHDIASVPEEYIVRRHRYSIGTRYEAWTQYARSSAPVTQGSRQPLSHEFAVASVPKLYLVGSDDRSSAAERCTVLVAEGHEHVQVRILEDCRHLVMLDAPARFADAVIAFLSS